MGAFSPAGSLAAVGVLSSIVASGALSFGDDTCGPPSLCLLQQSAKVVSQEKMQPSAAKKRSKQPNVLFIIADDLTKDLEGLAGHHPQVQTPNIKALIESGASFSKSYTSHPLCAPARASILMGILGSNSGFMTNEASMKNVDAFQDAQSLPQFFSKNGYYTIGTGKVFHQNMSNHFDLYERDADYGPVVVNEAGVQVNHPSIPYPLRGKDLSYVNAPLSELPWNGSKKAGWYFSSNQALSSMDYTSLYNRDPTPDEYNGAWVAEKIKNLASRQSLASRTGEVQPFFLAVGFVRPHTPHYLPDKFLKQFPLDNIQIPEGYLDNDLDDTAFVGVSQKEMFTVSASSYNGNKTLAMQHFLQGYLGAIASLDEQVGIVMEALNNSDVSNNTIVVFTSDHGFQLGQKDSFGKDTPWDQSLSVPLVIRAPGVTMENSKPVHPVTTLNIYPTLKDLCDLSGWTNTTASGKTLDGFSLTPFLKDPSTGKWNGPAAALSEVMDKTNGEDKRKDVYDAYEYHLSITKDDMRYIRVTDGSEEMYNHTSDPYEWTNIVNKSWAATKKKDLKNALANLVR